MPIQKPISSLTGIMKRHDTDDISRPVARVANVHFSYRSICDVYIYNNVLDFGVMFYIYFISIINCVGK